MQKNINRQWKIVVAFGLSVGSLGGCSHSSPTLTTGTATVPKTTLTQQTTSQLTDQLKKAGTFQGVQTSKIDSSYQVMTTTDDENYYIKDDHVVSSSRSPKDSEKKLIYWRTKFRGTAYRERELTTEVMKGHEQPLIELACDEKGVGVVYDPNREIVKKVFYYEAK